jgi:hypothetical protein
MAKQRICVTVSGLPGRDQPLLLKFTQNLKVTAKTGAAALIYLKDLISAEVKQPYVLTGAGFTPRCMQLCVTLYTVPAHPCSQASISGQIITRICRPRSLWCPFWIPSSMQIRCLLMTTGNVLPYSTYTAKLQWPQWSSLLLGVRCLQLHAHPAAACPHRCVPCMQSSQQNQQQVAPAKPSVRQAHGSALCLQKGGMW